MSQWYRTGTVAVTNGSPNVVGTLTLWLTQASVGDIFIGPDLALYEITTITDDTHLAIKKLDGTAAYNGATLSAQAYSIVRNFTSTLPAQLASQLADLMTRYHVSMDEITAWLSGTGSVTVHDSVGNAYLVKTPAQLNVEMLVVASDAEVAAGLDDTKAVSPKKLDTRLGYLFGVTAAVNDIGVAGTAGFGVGICPAVPAGIRPLSGCMEPASDNYGNYINSDGSIMYWRPAYFLKWGTGANGLAINTIRVKPYSAYASVAAANAAGYALPRSFYDGGVVKLGYFRDKYKCSNNGGIASSIKGGIPLSSAARGTLVNSAFANLTGAPPNFYYGAIAAAKTRGANFFVATRYMKVDSAVIALAQAQAATSTTWCAWYDATGVTNFPKGCNNNALGDAQDAAILYTGDGSGTPCGLTGSANLFSRTTDNGQNCGSADENGLLWEITPGLATDAAGTAYYALNIATVMKNVTGGNTLGTDLWGATGLAALYDNLGATYGAALASSSAKSYGSATQVLSEALAGNAWNAAGLGIPLVGGVGGTNLFGNDYFLDYRPADMCPISGGPWGTSSYAGVWALALYGARGTSDSNVGFRAALYL